MKAEERKALIAKLDKEASRVFRLKNAAELREHEAWDKSWEHQERISRTVAKHRAHYRRLDARIKALEAEQETTCAS